MSKKKLHQESPFVDRAHRSVHENQQGSPFITSMPKVPNVRQMSPPRPEKKAKRAQKQQAKQNAYQAQYAAQQVSETPVKKKGCAFGCLFPFIVIAVLVLGFVGLYAFTESIDGLIDAVDERIAETSRAERQETIEASEQTPENTTYEVLGISAARVDDREVFVLRMTFTNDSGSAAYPEYLYARDQDDTLLLMDLEARDYLIEHDADSKLAQQANDYFKLVEDGESSEYAVLLEYAPDATALRICVEDLDDQVFLDEVVDVPADARAL